MQEFKSWLSYSDFEEKTRHSCRYIFDQEVQEFLDTVLATSKKRHRKFEKGTNFWRAQLGHALKPIIHEGEHVADEPYPFPKERMKPIPHIAKEGRANPKGIPFLYLATDKETAMAESRPWLSAYISVGQFKINKDILLLDCSRFHRYRILIYLEEPSAKEREDAVWYFIDKAFSNPVTENDSNADYIPTQIIAEFFKANRFDGIFYKSNLGKGYNFVLFDINIADIQNCFLFQTNKIKFSFTEAFEQYFERKNNNIT